MKKIFLLLLTLGVTQATANNIYDLDNEDDESNWVFEDGPEIPTNDWVILAPKQISTQFMTPRDGRIFTEIVFALERQFPKLNSYQAGRLASDVFQKLMKHAPKFYTNDIEQIYSVKLDKQKLIELYQDLK